MDLVLKLREIRRLRGLSQKDVARLSGVGEKTISSFETGERIGSMKLAQLKRLLAVYGLTETDFFGAAVEKEIAPWELDEEQMALSRLLEDLQALPKQAKRNLLAKFQLMAEAVGDAHEIKDRRPSYVRERESAEEWQMLTSRN
jgi:HTH-type transcriptional regulator, competence development regulator